MKMTRKGLVLGLVGAGLFVAGVASSQTATDRYGEAGVSINKAKAYLNNILPANSAEKSQRDKALASLNNAQRYINCAVLRRENPKAVCE